MSHEKDKLVREDGHCDDYIDAYDQPSCLRWWLLINRLPATEKLLADEFGVKPKLFATYKGKHVRAVMASRLGDVGITYDLEAERGYDVRVMVAQLKDFSGDK